MQFTGGPPATAHTAKGPGRLDKLQLMNWIAQDRAAWDAGFAAGESGQTVTTCPYPAAAEESVAWYSGFIEGKAKRSGPPAA